MKRRIAALVCLLLFFAPAARAERDIGALARLAEADGRVLGMEVYRKTNLAWGSLPLVDAAANKALEGLCNALRIDTRAQGAWDAGYVSLDVMLQNTSVFDFTLMTRDGVYYEQSNLLGGATVGATKEEFADFVARLSAKSGGAMPQNMDILFDFVRLGLGGGDVNVDMDTINAALAAIDGWSKTALVKTEKLRPVSYMPGAYCARAEVIQITRDEALALTAALADVIGGDEALLMGAAAEQVYQGDETALREAVAKAKETLETLPDALGEALPEGLAPAEYRELFGTDGKLVTKQVQVFLPGDALLFLEWQPTEAGISFLYASLTVLNSGWELRVSIDRGEELTVAGVSKLRDRIVAEVKFIDPSMSFGAMQSTIREVERKDGVETIETKTNWTIDSPQLIGDSGALTIGANTTDVASGALETYKRAKKTDWTINGLGSGETLVLTVTTDTALRAADAPIDPAGTVERLGAMDDAAFEAFLKRVELGLTQVVYTIFGRLPPETAVYVQGWLFP